MKSKFVLILKGSPRKDGNSAMLAEQFSAGARSVGAGVNMVALDTLRIQPCSACDSCQESQDQDCIIDDDMLPIYPELRRADVVVIASPIYWFTVSAQTKLFIDRGFYAMGGPEGWKALASKTFVILLVYGDSDPLESGVMNAVHTFQDIFRYIGVKDYHFVHASASAAGEIATQEKVLDQVYQLGTKLAA